MRHNTLTLPIIQEKVEEIKKRIGEKIKIGKEGYCFVCEKIVGRKSMVFLEVPYQKEEVEAWTACNICYPAIKKERKEIRKKKVKLLNDRRRGLI
jgi:hypothetical protein